MRLENLENGRKKFISLPKSERRIAAMLVDIGVTFDTDMSYKISYIGTKNRELAKEMLDIGLSIEELNIVAEYMFDKTEYWENDFELLLKIFKPKTSKAFINLMYESLGYQFYNAANEEELGRLIRNEPEPHDGYAKAFLKSIAEKTDKEVGELFKEVSNGEFTNVGVFMLKHEISEEYGEEEVYDGINTNKEWYEMDNDPYCMCEVSVADMNYIDKEDSEEYTFLNLKLPMTMNEIHQALKPMKTDKIIYIVDDDREVFPTRQAEKMSLWEVNELAEIWEELYQHEYQIEKLYAILAYEGKSLTFENVEAYVQKMNSYRFYPEVDGILDVTHAPQIKSKYPNDDQSFQRMASKGEIVAELMRKFVGKFIGEFGAILCTNGEKGFEKYFEIESV